MNDSENRLKSDNIMQTGNCEEGPRMRQLRQAIEMTVNKFLSSAKYGILRDSYKPIHLAHPSCLTKLHNQMMTQLKESIMDELEDLYEEENIIKLMNGLDELIEKYPDKEHQAWRPSGNPDADLMAHTMAERCNQRSYLQVIVKELESQNKLLKEKYDKRKANLLQIHQQIIDQNARFGSEIAEAKAAIPSEELKKFLR